MIPVVAYTVESIREALRGIVTCLDKLAAGQACVLRVLSSAACADSGYIVEVAKFATGNPIFVAPVRSPQTVSSHHDLPDFHAYTYPAR